MSRTLVISPVTRIEGRASITIQLGADGRVADARLQATEFRGFEKFCEGRSFLEMPVITSRICGICPVSHQLASAAAGDAIIDVRVPEAATRLRRILNLAQIIQSHALSFFYFSSPDLLLGFDAPPERRTIAGVAAEYPELARGGIRLRQFGQSTIEALTGERIHSSWVVAGGVRTSLSAEARDRIRAGLPEALTTAANTLGWFKRSLAAYDSDVRVFGHFPTLFLGMVTPDGRIEHYGGKLRIVDSTGAIVADQLEPGGYRDYIGEAVEPWSYMKFPYYKPLGYPAGAYRVGPLARLNVASACGTPRADEELAEFRRLEQGAVLSSFHYHYARLIEILHAVERLAELIEDPDLLSPDVLTYAEPSRTAGVGANEAPRGTLFHRYEVDHNGLLTDVDLLIATGQNNLAMNRAILQIARDSVECAPVTESALNRIEAGIRAFDPCLSCATHVAGRLRVRLRVIDGAGAVIQEI